MINGNTPKKSEILELLDDFHVMASLGPHQFGKSTLAEEIAFDKNADYLNLEHPIDKTGLALILCMLDTTAAN